MPWESLDFELTEIFGRLSPGAGIIEEALWQRYRRDLARLEAFVAANIARGGCRNCGGPRMADVTHCFACARRNAERIRQGRRDRLAGDPSLCISCARNPRRPGRTTCEACKRYNRRFLDRRKAERRAGGVCDVCGANAPKATATYCHACHEKMRARARRQNKYPDQRENPKRVRLTPHLAAEIRVRRSEGASIALLATSYGVSESTISRVVNGAIWRTRNDSDPR